MEQMKAYHYGIISIEIVKNEKRFQLLVPLGVQWDEAEQSIDELKVALQEMRKIATSQAEQPKEEVLEPEVVSS